MGAAPAYPASGGRLVLGQRLEVLLVPVLRLLVQWPRVLPQCLRARIGRFPIPALRRGPGRRLAVQRRWVDGEFERKSERPITEAESAEDREILRIVHRPANRAEVLVSATVKHYLEMKAKEGE